MIQQPNNFRDIRCSKAGTHVPTFDTMIIVNGIGPKAQNFGSLLLDHPDGFHPLHRQLGPAGDRKFDRAQSKDMPALLRITFAFMSTNQPS
jgi:hypothetical protein